MFPALCSAINCTLTSKSSAFIGIPITHVRVRQSHPSLIQMSIQLNTECFVSEKRDILDKVAPDSERNKSISESSEDGHMFNGRIGQKSHDQIYSEITKSQ